MVRPVVNTFLASAFAVTLAACQEEYASRGSRHWVAMSPEIVSLMSEKGMSKSDPILIRSYKQESELEIWKKGRDGKYAMLKSFPICRWSGQLGPKVRQGDRQAPEGYYPISPAQMNPNSSFFLSFDTGFPNSFDRQLSRNGSFLMVHGACSSAGCFSMTDKQIADIYALVRDAHSGGQRSVQMQSFPFRMTAENLAKHRYNPHIAFWKNLKEGSDYFEVTREEPKVTASAGRYLFNAPETGVTVPESVRVAVARKQAEDNAKVAELVQGGTPAVKIVYSDGGQHASFGSSALAYAGAAGTETLMSVAANTSTRTAQLEMSRPEAIGAEKAIPIGPDGKPLNQTPKPVQVASAQSTPVAASAARAAPSVAAAATPAPAAAPQEKSMFGRLLGAVGLGGSTKEEQAAREEAIPLPPRRNGQRADATAKSAFTQSQ